MALPLQETKRYPDNTAVDLTNSAADEWIVFIIMDSRQKNMAIRSCRVPASIPSTRKLVYKNTFCPAKMTARCTPRQILRGGYHKRSGV
jgi:hypothetical protein